MKKKIIGILALIVLILLAILTIQLFTNLKKDKSPNNSTTEEIDTKVNLDNGDEKIDWESLEEKTLNLDNKSVLIDKDGIYTLSGKINNGNIIVNTSGDVKLILDNLEIKNDNGPAIVIEQANNTVIELKEDTINTLEDGNSYDNTEYEGCIFSKDDLIFQGAGTLKVKSNYLDGIVSKDDLKIVEGTYIIDSNDDGIRGKDSVYIKNGTFTITSKNDGIKTTNDTDQEKGYINIENGTFNIQSGTDGLQAETKLIIYNGNFNIKTSDGSSSSSSAIKHDFFNSNTYDSTSSKGMKSVDNLVIKKAIITIDSKDDAIHSNNYVGIENATITITSGDDGIHADNELIIDAGTIKINQSYEGLEANDITINGGDISIFSNDDGINISGGNDNSSMGGRPGQNNMSSSNGTLTITDGKIYVNATGDGLDANGNVIISGGTIKIDGPTSGGNGVIDYDISFEVNKGTFIAVGSRDMAQNISSSSKQNSLMFYLSKTYDNKKIIIEDSKGNEIINYTPAKKYQLIVVSSSKIKKDETYILKIDDQEIEKLKASSTNTSNSTSQDGRHNQPPGGGRR